MITIQVQPGDNMQATLRAAKRLAREENALVRVKTDTHTITVRAGSDVDALHEHYQQRRQRP